MQTKTEELFKSFPVRKTAKQKQNFREWVTKTLTEAGCSVTTESGKGLLKSNNIVVGDPDKADIIFTAHYDTPARLPFPNIIIPYSILMTFLVQLPLALIFMLPAIGAELLVLRLTDNSFLGLAALWAVVLALYALMTSGPQNPSNVNDNTSGVATLLETALTLPPEQREKAAFVFFDNEEKGLLGSAAFYERHKKTVKDTLLINFDCVSDGKALHFFPCGKLKKKHPEMVELLEKSFQPHGGKGVKIAKKGFTMYPSDQAHFPCGVGVAALNKTKLGYSIGRIHTHRDTVLQRENIELLRLGAVRLLEQIGNSEM